MDGQSRKAMQSRTRRPYPVITRRRKIVQAKKKKKKKNGEQDTIKLNATDDENESEIKQPQTPNFK